MRRDRHRRHARPDALLPGVDRHPVCSPTACRSSTSRARLRDPVQRRRWSSWRRSTWRSTSTSSSGRPRAALPKQMEWVCALGLMVTTRVAVPRDAAPAVQAPAALNSAASATGVTEVVEEPQQGGVERGRGFLLGPVAGAVDHRAAAEVGEQRRCIRSMPDGSITRTTSSGAADEARRHRHALGAEVLDDVEVGVEVAVVAHRAEEPAVGELVGVASRSASVEPRPSGPRSGRAASAILVRKPGALHRRQSPSPSRRDR